MSYKTQFLRKLHHLWIRRIDPIRRLIGESAPGPHRSFNRHVRERRIEKLLELATRIVRGKAREELQRLVKDTLKRRIRGYGIQHRADRILKWAKQRIRGPIVYSFWRSNGCLYVGKGRRWSRLRNYVRSIYLTQADTLEVYVVRGKSALPKAECLAVHLYTPRDNYVKPARSKWGKSCPVCKIHDQIQSELRSLFAL